MLTKSKSLSAETMIKCNGKPASLIPIACIFTMGDCASIFCHQSMISLYGGDSVPFDFSKRVVRSCANKWLEKKTRRKNNFLIVCRLIEQRRNVKIQLRIKLRGTNEKRHPD